MTKLTLKMCTLNTNCQFTAMTQYELIERGSLISGKN